MRDYGIGRTLAVAMLAAAGVAAAPSGLSPAAAQIAAMAAGYPQQLQVYLQARRAFEAEAEAYWAAVAEKRKLRFAKRRQGQAIGLDDYVLAQPPIYRGPSRPADPQPGVRPPVERKSLPVVADFIRAAADAYRIAPQRPVSEQAFKRAYARAASAAGLTPEQAVRVYAFETGGNGSHDVQAGLTTPRPGARAISTAIGYNQLLTANSVNLMAEQGPHIVAALTQRATRLAGAERQVLERKIAAVRRMVAVARSVPATWSEQQKLAATPQGWGIHAMVLDIDVGPLLQTHKLMTSVIFARRKGYARPLSAAELEMMNLTGDGNGFDMVTMPQSLREQVPTANFFLRSGYERNPVAIRHNTVAKLLAVTGARMDSAARAPGARELAAAFTTVLSSRD